jgi:outer membrane protein OmpA-like peptidoglycan-associated protein
MRILISGFVVFVIWCFISAWLYNDKLLPVLKKPAPVIQPVPDTGKNAADSIAKLKAMMPKDLMIYFEFDDSKIKADPQTDSRIPEFKAWLEKYPASMLKVTGYTDLVGTTEYNMSLGLKRAQIVEKHLEKQGINAGRIITESKGESDPASDYLTPDNRAKNRRTEISIKMQ